MNLDIPNVVVMLGIYVLKRQRLKKARKKKDQRAQNSPMENFPFLQELVTLYISLSNDS